VHRRRTGRGFYTGKDGVHTMTNSAGKRTRIEKNGAVAHLILDDTEKKVNTLGKELLEELNLRLDSLEKDDKVKAVVIRSAKPSVFIAGADIAEIQAIALVKDEGAGGREASRVGHELMNRIEDYLKPIVAGIHGSCLGGGLELAIACHGRVASNDPATKLGLPELKLGIVPGFGGTWRLPRLLGFVRGMTAILTAKTFDGKSALRQGLVDYVCFKEQLPQVAQELALKLTDANGIAAIKANRKKTRPLLERIMGLPVLKDFAASRARAEVIKKTGGAYPAPFRLIDLVSNGWGGSRSKAMSAEAAALGSTMSTRVCANLIKLFFLSQDAKKQSNGVKGTRIESAGIVGSGLMGSGIAVALTDRAKVKTLLKDTDTAVLGRALKKAWGLGRKRVERRQVEEVEAIRRFNLLSAGTNYGGFQRAQLVIEAVPEIMDLKRKVFSELETVVNSDAIIASNTSSLPITKLAEGSARPERFIGMHFFMPAEIMPLVEVIPGAKTSPQTIATIIELTLAMDKVPVVVKDCPGFLVNRVLAAYALEAGQLVEEGVPAGKVDLAAESFGLPMGPIRLIAEVGVEVMRKVLHKIQDAYGKNMAAPTWIGRDNLAEAFAKGKNGKWKVNGEIISGWVGKADPLMSQDDIQDRLYTALLNESVRCLEENVVASPGLLDLAMVYGIGFPPHRGGPMSEADFRGIAEVVKRANELAGKYGARLAPPALLTKMAANNSVFYPTKERS